MRKLLLLTTVVLVGLVFIARLFYLQVYSHSAYDIFEDSAIRKVLITLSVVMYMIEMENFGCKSTFLRCYGYSKRS